MLLLVARMGQVTVLAKRGNDFDRSGGNNTVHDEIGYDIWQEAYAKYHADGHRLAEIDIDD